MSSLVPGFQFPPLSNGQFARWDRPRLALTNGSDNRSAQALLQALAQFPIDDPFYAPGNGLTWCNIFAWHVSLALSVELPHWIRGFETRANDLCLWLEHRLQNGGAMQGPELGWREVDESTARLRANNGFPTFATWQNPLPQKPGHIALVRPAPVGRTLVAQAGRVCTLSGELAACFGGARPIRFWTND